MSFRELRSYLPKSGSSMIRLSIVGTTKLWLTRCAWTASSQACGSDWGGAPSGRPPPAGGGGGGEVFVGCHACGAGVVADELLDGLERGADGGGEVEVALADEDRLRLRVVHHVGDLFLLGAVIERDEHGAQLGAGVVGLHVGDGVERHGRHLIALADAQRLEGVGEAVDPLL